LVTQSAQEPRLVGLRELKKARTREALLMHALRLFDHQGYDATTLDQVAAAAEVSPRTLYRYFPTKEDLVFADDYDPWLLELLRLRPRRSRTSSPSGRRCAPGSPCWTTRPSGPPQPGCASR
jgi:AcrR family transcriptional regulator